MLKERIIAYTIGVVILIELIDGSALNTALPQIANSLHVNPISLKIAITVYLLTLGLFIPASGWLSDKIGSKKLLIISIVGFITSSFACGFSTNIIGLVIFRAIQGMFGAFTVPVARLAMVRIFKNNMLTAMSIIAVIATLGPMLGPLVGGVITTYISWRMIFFINIPIGIFAIILIYIYLPNTIKDKQNRFDLKGFIFIGISISLLMLFIDLLMDSKISLSIRMIPLIISIILFSLYIKHALSLKDNAVIDIYIFKNKSFKYFTIINTSTRLLIMGMMFIFPLYLQTKQGFNAFESGVSIMAFIIPAWYIKKLVKPTLKKTHYYKFFIINITLLAITYLLIATIILHFNLIAFLIALTILGACFGMFTIIINAGIYNSIDDNLQMSSATIINSTIIQLTSAFAISWVGIILATFSGIASLNFNSTISFSAFAWTQVIYSIGLLLILTYIIFCKPEDLKDVPIT